MERRRHTTERVKVSAATPTKQPAMRVRSGGTPRASQQAVFVARVFPPRALAAFSEWPSRAASLDHLPHLFRKARFRTEELIRLYANSTSSANETSSFKARLKLISFQVTYQALN